VKQTIEQMAAEASELALSIGLQAEDMADGFRGAEVVANLKEAITALKRAGDALQKCARNDMKVRTST
jgi:hypothetical protein